MLSTTNDHSLNRNICRNDLPYYVYGLVMAISGLGVQFVCVERLRADHSLRRQMQPQLLLQIYTLGCSLGSVEEVFDGAWTLISFNHAFSVCAAFTKALMLLYMLRNQAGS